ncbi:aldose epimerase family protein [Spirosoma oryzicola]|uniref:aldose epimerase family protein n=1 Tax=Spirosoma oryzicola TaxID=2898794 RepID=UPI001E30FD4A|nr:aldose epimerase family protein [Spirosoma oryzicola]UHG90447.1 galactose mutarotase [Spirosoma oryzicola]
MQKLILPVLAATLIGLNACQPANKSEQKATDSVAVATGDTTAMIDAKLPDPASFGGEVEGKKAQLFILKNKDIQVAISNYGARIVGLLVPDKNGKMTDVAPGFSTVAEYQKPDGAFFGPVVGRFGNRIAKGKFTLDGKPYSLELNNNGNTLHSGPSGFHNHVWDAKQVDDKTVEMTYVSKDGEGGFPGTVTTKVTFSLTDDDALKIVYSGKTDKATPYNPTSHGFFNLNGEGSGTVNDHVVMINADKYSVVDKGLIPQGEPASVEGTPFDFRKPTAIGARVNEKNEQLTFAGGYDHNWVLNKTKPGEMTTAAEVIGDKSGIKMQVLTTEPAMQFYGGNFFKGTDIGKYGKPTVYRGAFAMETQHYPDSPNHPSYPTTILKPGQTYSQTTEYRFSTVK